MKTLMRDMSNRMVGGVCAGIGRHFEIDVSIIRIAFVLGAFMWGTAFLIYILMWICIPKDNNQPKDLKRVFGIR